MNLEKIKSQQTAFRIHQSLLEEFNTLLMKFGECLEPICAEIVSKFSEIGISAEVSQWGPQYCHIILPPSQEWVKIRLLAHLTFNNESNRSEFINPRGPTNPPYTVSPTFPMSLPIEISVSHEYGGIGWVSDIWWRVSNDNERIVKIAIDSFLKKSGPREIKFTKQFDIMNSCFVATEIFGEQSKEVVILRYWRNEYLSKSFWGRSFISIYYWLGPHFAIAVRKSNLLKSFIRSALLKMCKKLSKHYLL